MSGPARSLLVFGGYVVLAGLGLALAPALVLGPLGFPPPADGWVRVVGVLAMCVGSYNILAARRDFAARATPARVRSSRSSRPPRRRTIGDNSTIGAGSIVTASIPSDTLAYGQPCRVQRTL